MKNLIIGVDLGGTKICTAIADKKGRIILSETVPTEAKKGRAHVIRRIEGAIIKICKDSGHSLSSVESIGIGAPGPVLADKGVILDPPNLSGWKRVYLRDIISRRFRKKVFLENDANCAAIGELRFGAGKAFTDFVYVTISTGIGGGIIIGKKLYRGVSGSAGEIGHMVIDIHGPKCGCGKIGHLEALASGPAMARRSKMPAEEIGRLAKKRDKKALEAIRYNGWLIGKGFANIVNIINPEAIIVGGGVSNLGKPLFDSIKKTVRESALDRVRIIPAQLKKDVGVIGAIALCL
jgi:glucokinase